MQPYGVQGQKTRHAGHQGACAGDVKAVHVLGRADGFDDLLRVDVPRQRQLHQDAVDGRIVVEGFDARQQGGFAHVGVVCFEYRVQAAVFAGLDLVAHIDLAGRVVADQHHGQARGDALHFEGLGAVGDFGAQLFGQGIAINQLGGHKRLVKVLRS